MNPVRPVALLALLTFTSCSDDLLGPLNDTVFVLESIDGEALPTSVVNEFGGLAWIVTADTIWFESGHKWRRHSFQRREEGVGGDPLDISTDGKIVRQNDLLILSFDCKNGECLTPDRVIHDATTLEMEITYLHDGRKLIFRQI